MNRNTFQKIVNIIDERIGTSRDIVEDESLSEVLTALAEIKLSIIDLYLEELPETRGVINDSICPYQSDADFDSHSIMQRKDNW